MYHNMGDESGFNTIAKQNFIDQLDYLKTKNYTVVSFDTYIDHILKKSLDRDTVTFSFDDAYKSFADIAVPVLEQYHYPAILFIPAGFVGKYNQWDENLTAIKIPVMSWHELASVSANPLVTIGSHGLSHQALSSLSESEIEKEIAESKKMIEANLNISICYFSYPYGQFKHFNSAAIDALKKNNYRAACSTNWDRYNSAATIYKLNRIEVEPDDTLNDFQKKISGRHHIKHFKQIIKNLF